MATIQDKAPWPSLLVEGDDPTGWKDRHGDAVQYPRTPHERALVNMLRGWQQYASASEASLEWRIGDDCVLGPEWLAIGKAIKGLLDGEIGQLDGGTVWSYLHETAIRAGFERGMDE